MKDLTLPYYSFNKYLKERYQTKVWRVSLEGNFDCPNRDGKRAFGGCTFCTADGSSSRAQSPTDHISKQLVNGIEKQRKRHQAQKFIAYLQSFTNTYGTLENLESTYTEAISHPDVVVLAIGTRPDCLENQVIDLINSFTNKVEVWIDLGLQSIHEQTLNLMNRAHTSEEFFMSLERIKKRAPAIKVCAHMIAGLPPEDKNLKLSLETGLALTKAPIDGIKIHNLCILKNTRTAKEFQENLVKPLMQAEYRDLVIEILINLSSKISVHRLMAEAPQKDELLAPKWANNKNSFLSDLTKKMIKENLFQGCKLS